MSRERKNVKKRCDACIETISCGLDKLPENFTAADLTAYKSKGWLTFSTSNLFYLMSRAEFLFLDFCEMGDDFKDGAFSDLLYTICVESLPKVGCQIHYREFMSNLLYDYCILRFKCLGKKKRMEVCETRRTQTHTKRKMSKLI